jgi:hypothetical protein
MRYAARDRVFRYCLADQALLEKRGAAMGDTLHEQNTAMVASAGDQDITIVLAAAAEDQFKDGYINIWTAIVQVCLEVKGNEASDGVNTVIHLAEPLLYDVALATFTDLHENKYRSVMSQAGGDPHRSVVCIPLVPVPANHYFWGQTWGDVVGIAHAGGGIGANANERSVYFANDGSIGLQSDVVGTVNCQQAGFMLPDTSAGDDIFFMLQLAP